MADKKEQKEELPNYLVFGDGSTEDVAQTKLEEQLEMYRGLGVEMSEPKAEKWVVAYRKQGSKGKIEGHGDTYNDAVSEAKSTFGRDIPKDYNLDVKVRQFYDITKPEEVEAIKTKPTPPSAGGIKKSTYTLEDRTFTF